MQNKDITELIMFIQDGINSGENAFDYIFDDAEKALSELLLRLKIWEAVARREFFARENTLRMFSPMALAFSIPIEKLYEELENKERGV